MDTIHLDLSTDGAVTAGGYVALNKGYSSDPTTSITGGTFADKQYSFVIFNVRDLPSYAIEALRENQVDFKVEFTTSTSSTIPATVKVFAASTNDAIVNEAANPSASAASSAYTALDDRAGDPIASLTVKKGVPPFSSDTNQNTAHTIDVTAQALAAYDAKTNLVVFFTGSGTAAGVSTNITNVTANIFNPLLPVASDLEGDTFAFVGSGKPFSTAFLTSSLPSSLPTDDPTTIIFAPPGDGMSTKFLDYSSSLSRGTNDYEIIQSDASVGTLSGDGLQIQRIGQQIIYYFSGTPADATTILKNLSFTATPGAGNSTTSFKVQERSGLGPFALGAVDISTGSVSNASIGAGRTQFVGAGGASSGTKLDGYVTTDGADQGTQTIQAGGIANGTVVLSGRVNVLSGGTTSGTLLRNKEVGAQGPTASYSSFAEEIVSSGGVANGTSIGSSSRQVLLAGGKSYNTQVLFNGAELISAGAEGHLATVNARSRIDCYGSVYDASISGTLAVFAGGSSFNTKIMNGGIEYLLAYASAYRTTINSGGKQEVSGAVFDATVLGANGVQTVMAGGSVTRTQLTGAGAKLVIADGGSATNTGTGAGTSVVVTGGAVVDGIAGGGELVKNGTGTLTLKGTIAYTGGTTIAGGTLSVVSGDSSSGWKGGLTFTGGVLETKANTVVQGAVKLSATGSIQVTNGITTTFSGVVSGTSGLSLVGGGTLVLSGANTYSGGTSVSGSTLSISSDRNLGAITGGLSFDNGILRTTGTFTSQRQLSFANQLEVKVDLGKTTWSGPISGSGTFIKSGAGTLAITGSNTYSGDTWINGGTLAITADPQLGDRSKSLIFNGGTLETADGVQSARSVIINGAGTIHTTGTARSTFTGTITDGSGPGSLTKTGTGTLVLSGASTYSGNTIINAGTLELASSTKISGTMISMGPAGRGAIAFHAAAGQTATLTLGTDATPGSGATFAYTLVDFGAGDALNLKKFGRFSDTSVSYVGGKLTVTNSNGSVSFTLSNPGASQFYVHDSGDGVLIDTVGPSAPDTLSAPTLAAASDTGALSSDGITMNATPTFTGFAAAGTTVTLTEGNFVLGTAIAQADGSYTIQSSHLADGTHLVNVTTTDAAGNVSNLSPDRQVIIDTSVAQPLSPTLTALSDTGRSQIDRRTQDATPTFTGTTEAGATVALYEGKVLLATATAGNTGMYQITAPQLADGRHVLNVTATDVAGNVSTTSTGSIIYIDTHAPDAPLAPALATASDTGRFSDDRVTRDARPTFTGMAEAGATVTLYDANAIVGRTTANASGTYSVTSSALADGTHSLTVIATDVSGNASAGSPVTSVTIDTTPPATLVAPALDAASDTGTSSSDGLTNDTTPTFTGLAEAGAVVTLYDGTKIQVGSTIAGDDGRYTITASGLSEGVHSLRVQATDAAGNVSALSPGRRIVIDTMAPETAITSSGGSTSKPNQRISGTGEFGTTVALHDNGALVGTATVGRNGTWSSKVTLSEGTNDIVASGEDKAGNVGTSQTISYDYMPANGARAAAFAELPAGAVHSDLAMALFNAAFTPGAIETAAANPSPTTELLSAAGLSRPPAFGLEAT